MAQIKTLLAKFLGKFKIKVIINDEEFIGKKFELFVDGHLTETYTEFPTITINGDVEYLDTMSGHVKADSVTGSINTMSGDVRVLYYNGTSISTMSGAVNIDECESFSGKISTVSGDVNIE